MTSPKPAEQAPRLGRGLAALLAGAGPAQPAGPRPGQKLPIAFLNPNPRNPRQDFDGESLDELAASIKEKGIIQPIVVRPVSGRADAYEIIAGERRWRAAQRAGLHEAPVVIVEADDRQALELAIVENVQRNDLNPLEEAAGYERLAQEFEYSQSDLARVIGKSRSHVNNTLRLLRLPERTKTLLREGKISAGHARALITSADPDALADKIVAQGLSVRQAERLASPARSPGKEARERSKARSEARTPKDADTRAMEKTIMEQIGMEVVITPHSSETGELLVRYKSLDQLDLLCRLLRAG